MEPEGVGRCRRYQRAPPSGPPPAASPDVKDICRENTRRPLVTNLEGARVGGLLWPSHSRRESPALRPAPCSQPSCHSRWRTRPKRAIKIGALAGPSLRPSPSGHFSCYSRTPNQDTRRWRPSGRDSGVRAIAPPSGPPSAANPAVTQSGYCTISVSKDGAEVGGAPLPFKATRGHAPLAVASRSEPGQLSFKMTRGPPQTHPHSPTLV